jgi:hypothetical protein
MITVYQVLACEDIMFEGQVDSPKTIKLLYDDFEQHSRDREYNWRDGEEVRI